MSRMYAVEEEGFDDTYIIVENNGQISNYVPPVLEVSKDKASIIDEEYVVDSTQVVSNLTFEEPSSNNVTQEGLVKQIDEPIDDETTYRIQIGAFKKPLSDKIFVGVDNVINFIGKDGLIRYMAGSFSDYKKAVDYQVQ